MNNLSVRDIVFVVTSGGVAGYPVVKTTVSLNVSLNRFKIARFRIS